MFKVRRVHKERDDDIVLVWSHNDHCVDWCD